MNTELRDRGRDLVQINDDGTHVILLVATRLTCRVDHAGVPVMWLRHADGKVRRDGFSAALLQRPSAVDEHAPGDEIAATLIVDGTNSFLEDIVITRESSDTGTTTSGEGVGPKAGDEVPDYRLINQDGKAIRLHDYKGKALLLTFIYTRCQDPGQCTLMSSNFATVDKELQKQPELYAKTHLLSISFDPEYDTPKVLRSYGAAYTGKYSDENFAHWEFASGSADEVKGIAQYFGMRYYTDSSKGTEQVIHSLRTAVIGPDGKVVKVYRGNDWKVDEILKDIQVVFTSSGGAPGAGTSPPSQP